MEAAVRFFPAASLTSYLRYLRSKLWDSSLRFVRWSQALSFSHTPIFLG